MTFQWHATAVSTACRGTTVVMPWHFHGHRHGKPTRGLPRYGTRVAIDRGRLPRHVLWLCPQHVPWNFPWLRRELPRHVPRQTLHGKHHGTARGNSQGKLRGNVHGKPHANIHRKPHSNIRGSPARQAPRESQRRGSRQCPRKAMALPSTGAAGDPPGPIIPLGLTPPTKCRNKSHRRPTGPPDPTERESHPGLISLRHRVDSVVERLPPRLPWALPWILPWVLPWNLPLTAMVCRGHYRGKPWVLSSSARLAVACRGAP